MNWNRALIVGICVVIILVLVHGFNMFSYFLPAFCASMTAAIVYDVFIRDYLEI